jgi:hypothetical protein
VLFPTTFFLGGSCLDGQAHEGSPRSSEMPELGVEVVTTDTDLEAISVVSDHFLSQEAWVTGLGGPELSATGLEPVQQPFC